MDQLDPIDGSGMDQYQEWKGRLAFDLKSNVPVGETVEINLPSRTCAWPQFLRAPAILFLSKDSEKYGTNYSPCVLPAPVDWKDLIAQHSDLGLSDKIRLLVAAAVPLEKDENQALRKFLEPAKEKMGYNPSLDVGMKIPLPADALAILQDSPELSLFSVDGKKEIVLTTAEKKSLLDLLLDESNWCHGLFTIGDDPKYFRLIAHSKDNSMNFILGGSLISAFKGDDPSAGRTGLWNETGQAKYNAWLKDQGVDPHSP